MVDLGAAPGGWSQIAAERVGAADGKGKVMAIDLLEMPEIPGVTFAQLDFLKDDAPEGLREMMGGRVDVVLSDMAANPPAIARPTSCASSAWSRAPPPLPPTCSTPAVLSWPRYFKAAPTRTLMTVLKRDFATVKHVKPASSRKDFSERYVLAMGFRGKAKEPVL